MPDDSLPSNTRREFLTGQAAANALANLADRSASASSPSSSRHPAPPSQEEAYLLHLSRRAMACQFELFLNAGQYEQGTEAGLAALDLVEALETQLTVYRDDSELMGINRAAAERPVPVEAGLFELLKLAQDIHRQTGGAHDITSGPLSKVWGFYRRQGRLPEEADLQAALAVVSGRRIELDEQARTVRFATPGMELNLGSIGKGYALDRCATLMEQAGMGDFLWHGGQSSVLARGSRASTDGARGWLVGIGDPLRPGKRLAELMLRDRAMGTSGAATQFFRHGGKRYGHVLDPRTGWPAEGALSATVLAPTAAEADALSTAFYVLGPQESLAICQGRPDLAMVMVVPGAGPGSVNLVSAGLAEGELRLRDQEMQQLAGGDE